MSVAQEIERLKVSIPTARRPTESLEQVIIRLYTMPKNSLRTVAEAADCSIETVRRVLLRHGIARNPPHTNLQPHSGHTRGPKV